MTNREWLNSLSDSDFVEKIYKGCGVCAFFNDKIGSCLGRSCEKGIKEWLEAEHTVPLELCPFKCKGCSREVSLGFTGSLYYVRHFRDILYSKYCHLRIKGEGIAYYSKESDAVEAWNKTVRGE